MATDEKGKPRTQSTGFIPGQFAGLTAEEHAKLLSGRTPTEVPANPPTYFLSDLWPQTYVLILEARKKFPFQSHMVELCRYIVSEMTPLFCEAVKAGKMKADEVQRENGGGMEDLLHSLLAYNDSGIGTGFGLSNEAFRLGKKVRESDEWLALAKAINSTRIECLRTGGKQVESPLAQNSEKTTQSEAKSSNRRKLVEAYVQEVFTKTGKRITRKEIWTKAGYNSRTEFERWERQDPNHPNKAADKNFSRILREKPHLK